jgi:hypothetical protein
MIPGGTLEQVTVPLCIYSSLPAGWTLQLLVAINPKPIPEHEHEHEHPRTVPSGLRPTL